MLSNVKDNQIVPVMHGENFLRRVDALPKGKTTKAKMYVVGHSETGHNHVLTSKSDLEVLEQDGKRFMLVNEVAELFHKKSFDVHETISVEPGIYEVTHKTEYDPFAQVIRQVWD
jgi:hypothetical protein